MAANSLMTEPPPSEKRERPERNERDRPPRKTRDDLATYRIAVGKRHKVGPGSIVGALANEGGLHRSDFGTSASSSTTHWSNCPPSCLRRR